MNYPKEKIKEIYRSLPENLSDLIDSDETLVSISQIAQENKLNPDQTNALGNEITMRIIGVTTKENFESEIQNKIIVDELQAKKLAFSIEQNILSKVSQEALEEQERLAQEKLMSVPLKEETLKSIPDQKPETQEIAPRVIVEAGENKPSVNLIQPPVVQAPIELKPKEPTNIVESKLREVVAVPKQTSSYPDGVDPYREPTQ